MVDLYLLESAITLIVVALQTVAFVATWRTTRRLATLFPADPNRLILANQRLELPPPVRRDTRTLLDGTNRRLATMTALEAPIDVVTAVAIRTSARLEQQAAATANAPVFLGLIGTFAGIIAGLVQVSMRTSITEDTIRLLLGGVLVAMIGSLCGVCLMVLATAIVLPRARRTCDAQMDSYLLVAQALLPQRVATPSVVPHESPQHLSTAALQALADFNHGFTTQVERFHTAVDTLSSTVDDQRKGLETLEHLDLARIVTLNVEFLSTSQAMAGRFEKFGASLDAFTTAMNGAGDLVQRIGQVLDRVTRFEESINALGARIAADQSVTGQTIVLIRSQLDAIRARTDLVQEYVAVEDTRVEKVVAEHRQQIEQLAARAAQSIDRIGQEIATEVARATDPVRVESLMEQMGQLPGLISAATRTAEAGVVELRDVRSVHDATLAELRTLTGRMEESIDRGVWSRTRRAVERMLRRQSEE
jgi:hypothetical protein